MIQLFVDNELAFDSRWEKDTLEVLKAKTAINKGGVATIGMPPGHPYYSKIAPYKSIIEIRKNNKLKFRGRALPPTDNYYNQRTVLCEGEMCFLRDIPVSASYFIDFTPAHIFEYLMEMYNEYADPEKQFVIGTVEPSVTESLSRFEIKEAEPILDAINSLIELVGGYIIFTSNVAGQRVINWYGDIGYQSNQSIEFDTNLLDFTRDSTTNESIATAIQPYGATYENAWGTFRYTLSERYIVDEEARAERGLIIATQTWDDITDEDTLRLRAQEWLAANRNIVSTLRLTALDLSYVDATIDTYEVGDKIHVFSKPHKLDDGFMLTEREEDFLNPKNGTITLGKAVLSLSEAAVAGDDISINTMYTIAETIKADYQLGIAKAVEESEEQLYSHIDQTSESIRSEVSEQYTVNQELVESMSSTMTQTTDQFLYEFENLKATVDEHDSESRANFSEIYKYISFKDGSITLGSSENNITLTIENDVIVFKKNGAQFGWWDGVDFHTGNIVVEVNERAQFGNFAFVPRSNGSLSFLKIK